MPDIRALWESYFYPETYDPVIMHGTLRNLFGVRDAEALSELERIETGSRLLELEQSPDLIEQTFDSSHLRAIHKYLFQDVYEWAGQYRTVDMAKNGSSFATVTDIDKYLSDVHSFVTRTQWSRLDREDFAHHMARVYALINQAHPFREGNGRTGKVFLTHVARKSNFELRFNNVTKHDWNMTSALSGADPGSYEVAPDPLVPVFHRIATPKPSLHRLPPMPGMGQKLELGKETSPKEVPLRPPTTLSNNSAYGRGVS